MKDLHSHLCYGIDDGASSIEESVSILKQMQESGFTDVLITPHYIEGSKYTANNKEKQKRFAEIQATCQKENININLYLGNEVYISNNIIKLIKQRKIMTLNNSKYILIEFPLYNEFLDTKNVLRELIVAGYKPVISHPERYPYIDSKMTLIYELKAMGVLFQGNYLSLFDKYGRKAKKNLKKMLKNDIISFIGSDIHHKCEFHEDKIYKKIKKYVKKDDKVKALLYNNFDIIINNK